MFISMAKFWMRSWGWGDKEYGADVLLVREASKYQGRIVDGGDDEEVYPCSRLTWRMVEMQWEGMRF